jgi:signal transduction histidine kinase
MIQQARIVQMGEMITNLSHHWRQPLNLIGLNIQDIVDAYDYGELSREYLEEIANKSLYELQRMSTTIDQYRELITVRKGKKLFSLHEAIETSIELIAPAMSSHFIHIEKDLDTELNGLGDPSQFSQALINILNNAREAMVDRDSNMRTVEVKLFRGAGGCPEITISDTAGGIDENVLSRIFEPFFTTYQLATKTGTGLYFTKMIIEEELEGSITAENTQSGALFVIRLPCIDSSEGGLS